MTVPDRPREDQPFYGEHLGDTRYWQPWIRAAAGRAGVPDAELEAPFVGTFPTFLYGDVVVKLFGACFDGPRSYECEAAMHAALASTGVPAAAVVASGTLYDAEPCWPFLITGRVAGVAIRDAAVDDAQRLAIAHELGTVMAAVHRLSPPAAVAERALLPELRTTAPDRLRRFGLPPHLVDQVVDYLADAEAPSVLIHADLTADHLFIDGGTLAAIIDWGDAQVADPYYELVAVYYDAFRGRRDHLDGFLAGYGWRPASDFPRRALQGVLEFQFNAIGAIASLVPLDAVATLDELADRLYG